MAVVDPEEAEYGTSTKQAPAHAALCGLEHRQTARVLGGEGPLAPAEEYARPRTQSSSHRLRIMLTQIMIAHAR